MSDRTPQLYTATAFDPDELRRAARICLLGTVPPAKPAPGAPDFAVWAAGAFPDVLVPHLHAVRAAAEAGELPAVLAADTGFPDTPLDASLGREWLTARTGARHEGLTRRFAAAVAAGKSPGNFHTVLAVQAAVYHIPLLPLFQTALFCEWHRRQAPPASRSLDSFLRLAGPQLSTLPALLSRHAPPAPIALPRGAPWTSARGRQAR